MEDEERILHSESELDEVSDEQYFLECVRFDELAEVKRWLEGKFDANCKDESGNTPLRSKINRLLSCQRLS